ncbi:MAG TPA: FMN-binding protein [Thermomicrobiaceae bacterium]|nr:FMN-binding protein [Thermomicrobiaceae bacterium]
MKKLSIATLIIGAFVFYSFLHAQTSGAVLDPKTLADAPPAVTTPTTTTAGTAPGTSTTAAAADPPSPTTGAQPTATTAQAAQPTATTAPTPQPTPTTAGGQYKDGSYTGSVADAQWGYIQVKAVISQGKIADVQFLQYPSDRSRSVYINSIADPELKSEAIQVQSAQVDIISGATDSSEAFMQSLTDALTHAQA